MNRILITGGCGQLGMELATVLALPLGENQIFLSDIHEMPSGEEFKGKYFYLDAMDKSALKKIITENEINQIYHLAAILSANGEKDPSQTWQLNMNSLINVLELGVELKLNKIFWPSSIAVFGSSTPKKKVTQLSVCEPETMYGVTKLSGERLCAYYAGRYGLDIRSIRFPGLISYKTAPGGGTTDYAVDIFHHALDNGRYTCFLDGNTALPFMYMPDAVRATMMLMDEPGPALKVRGAYNVSGFCCTPEDLKREIKRYIPDFIICYKPDFRQQIADSWPDSVDDKPSKMDWKWKPQFNIGRMVKDMLANVKSERKILLHKKTGPELFQ